MSPGRHYGEWWGSGVQRGYGLTNGEKRLSLFNVGRWSAAGSIPHNEKCSCGACPKVGGILPSCVGLVPILYAGLFSSEVIDGLVDDLRANGSKAAPGFMRPEGIIIYHAAARSLFKVTLDKDEEPKSAKAVA